MGAATSSRVTAASDLTGVAGTAQRALGSDALVILLLEAGQPPAVMASEGLTGAQRERLAPSLAELSPLLEQLTPLHVAAGASPAGRNTGLLRHGYVAALGAAAPLGAGRLAAVVGLRRESGQFENADLIDVFAVQAATALDQRRRRERLVPEVDRVQGLIAVDQLVRSATSVEELSAALTEAVAPLFGAESTGLMVWDDRRQVLRMLAGSFDAGDPAVAACQISADDFRSSSARVFSAGRGYFSNDVRGEPALFEDFVDDFAIERVLSVPLILAGRAIGVLHLANKATEFTPEDLQRAESLAPEIATVVEIAQAHLRLRNQRRLEEVLADVAVALASGVSVRDFLVPALAELGRVAEASLLALVPENDTPILWRHGDARPEVERVVLAEAESQPGVRAYVVGPTSADDPGWAAFHVPVHLGTQRVGTLVALRVGGGPFVQEERDAIVRLANLTALARATERYQQQRAELARLHERQRIAEGLHDDVAQLLFAAQLNLDVALEREGVDRAVAEGVSQSRALLVRADTTIRTVINRLSSPPTPDLALRLASAVSDVENVFSQPIHLEISPDAARAGKRLRRGAGDALVQVARHTAITAARREGPRRISVGLEHVPPDCVVLTVEDDGVGGMRRDTRDFTPLRQRIAEFGGSLRVRHTSTGGRHVTARVTP